MWSFLGVAMVKTVRNTVLTGRIISILLLSLLAPICTLQAQTFTFKSKKTGKEAFMPIEAAYFSDTIISLYQDYDNTMPENLDTERLTKVLNELDEVIVDEEINQQDDVPVEGPVNDLCLIINYLKKLHSTYKKLVPTLSFPKDLDKREAYAPKVIETIVRRTVELYEDDYVGLPFDRLEPLINNARYLGISELIHIGTDILVMEGVINEHNYKIDLWKEKLTHEELERIHRGIGKNIVRNNPDAFYPVILTAVGGDKRIRKRYDFETLFLDFHPNNQEFILNRWTAEEDHGLHISMGNVEQNSLTRSHHRPLFLHRQTGGIINGIMHPSGKVAATSAEDNTVKIWNLETGVNMRTLTFEASPYIQYSPDGSKLVVVSNLKTRIYDTITYALEWELPGVNLWGKPAPGGGAVFYIQATHVNPQSTLLATIDSGLRQVIIWDIASQSMYYRFPKVITLLQNYKCTDAKFSPDGNKIAIGCSDGAIHIFNVHTKELCNTLLLEEHAEMGNPNVDHPGINELMLHFSKDGKKLFVVGDLDSIQLWDIETNTLLIDIDHIVSNRQRHGPNKMGAWYSLNGQFIATQNSTGIRVNGTNVRELSQELWKYLDGQLNIEQAKLCIKLYEKSKSKNINEVFDYFEGPKLTFWKAGADLDLFETLPKEIQDILQVQYSINQMNLQI